MKKRNVQNDTVIQKYIYVCVFICSLIFLYMCNVRNVYGMDSEGNIVVVLDPGHGGLGGGSDDGASYNGVTERFINLTVANAAKEELEKYDNVKVYLTRNSADESITLKNRAEYAQSVNADFVFSIHFNASELHEKYGAEVWVPSIGRYYAEGYKFAYISTGELEKMGLFIRGIKTRIGDGEDEYYGIIRECEHRDIPAVIIEHCYVDNMYNYKYYSQEEKLIEFGKADATAIAKYFRLKSSENDYSDYPLEQVKEPAARIYHDMSNPDVCEISLNDSNMEKDNLSFSITGKDNESDIIYYSYSLDGGANYSDLLQWIDDDNDGIITVMISNPGVNEGRLSVKIYNAYDLSTDSNMIDFKISSEENNESNSVSDYKINDNNNSVVNDNNKDVDIKIFEAVLLVTAGVASTLILIKKFKGKN